jgi:hypothetical protein
MTFHSIEWLDGWWIGKDSEGGGLTEVGIFLEEVRTEGNPAQIRTESRPNIGLNLQRPRM